MESMFETAIDFKIKKATCCQRTNMFLLQFVPVCLILNTLLMATLLIMLLLPSQYSVVTTKAVQIMNEVESTQVFPTVRTMMLNYQTSYGTTIDKGSQTLYSLFQFVDEVLVEARKLNMTLVVQRFGDILQESNTVLDAVMTFFAPLVNRLPPT